MFAISLFTEPKLPIAWRLTFPILVVAFTFEAEFANDLSPEMLVVLTNGMMPELFKVFTLKPR